MDLNIVQLFIRFCVSYACHCSDLNLTKSKREELISLLEECLVMALFVHDIKMIVTIYYALGYLFALVHKSAQAIDNFQNALIRITGRGNHAFEMAVNDRLGSSYSSVCEYHKAIKYHEKSLSIAKKIGNRRGEGDAYGKLGNAYNSLGEYHKSIEYQKKMLDIAKEIGDKQKEGGAYGNLGAAYVLLGECHKAIEYQKKMLDIAKEIGDREQEGIAYINLGATYCSLGEYHKAIEYEEKSLIIAKEIGNRLQEGSAYENLGNAYRSLGKYCKAIEYHEKRLRITKEMRDKRGGVTTYGNLGANYDLLGEYHKAIKYYKKMLDTAKETADRQGEGRAYGNLGATYQVLGEYNKTIEYNEKMLDISKEIGYRKGERDAYDNLGTAYSSLGQYHKAIECHKKSLDIAIGDREGEAATYTNLGSAYQVLGEYQKSIEYHEKTLDIAKEIGHRKSEGTAYGNLGAAYKSLGEYHKAIKFQEKRLSIAKEIGDREGEGDAYGNLGAAYKSLGEYHKAIKFHEKRLNIAKEIGDRRGQASSHHNIGLAYEEESSIKDLSKSKEHLEKSIQCYESLFDDLKDKDQFKVSIVDTFIKTYKLLSQVYVKTGQSEEALLVCEHGRARALRDLLLLRYNTTVKTESKELELADVKTISSHREVSILFYNLRLDKVTYHSWVISSRNPSTFFYDEIDNFEALARIVLSLSEVERKKTKTGYFQYLVDNCFQQLNVREGKGKECEDRSIDLLDHEDLESVTSTNSLKISETALKCFRQLDRNTFEEEDDDVVNYLDVLFHRLVSPVLDHLTHDEVIIIPDGPLFMVPFAALQDPKTGKYLSETKCIRLAPSLTTLKILQESSRDQHSLSGAVIIGNPTGDLPGAEKEAVEIGELLGVQPLIGKQATKEVILEKLKQGVSVIHFAAHGSKEKGQILLAPSNPTMDSCPTDDKGCILTMKEAQESGIRAQLVVLSCCHSGKGDIRSEGVVGIARAFLAAGARAVVASLWAIDDTATKFFMLKFYSHLKNGESASKSLQQAMKEMREIERYKEPKYWAAFFLIGDNVTITV